MKPPKPLGKKGRPKKTQTDHTTLVDEVFEAEPQMGQPSAQEPSQFDVGGSSSGRVKHKARKWGNTKQKTKRLSRLGRWLGIGESELETDPIEATPTSQTASTTAFGASGPFAATQSSQGTNQEHVAEQQQAAPRPRARVNLIKPRERSERILKKKLAKDVPGIGSSKSNVNALD